MQIKARNKLSQGETEDIKELVSQCNKEDGLSGFIDVDTSINFNKDMKSVFMLYDDDKLASVLTLFAPGNKEAEVSAMTLPQYRLRGYFAELVKRAEAELKKYEVPDLLFLCESKSEHGKTVIAKQNAKYEFAEYLLKYGGAQELQDSNQSALSLREAEMADLEKGIELSMAIFNDSYEGARSIVQNILKADNRKLFLGQIEDIIVGMGGFSLNGNNASINGFGILSQYQGRGYGKQMLYLIINRLLAGKIENIYLEVDSENAKAFELYKKVGFEVVNAWEYYRKTI